MKVRIGTRGSDLALWQARHVAERLRARPGVEVELVVLKTRGDRIDDVPLQSVEGQGFFTAEIEQALRACEVDLAVHSHKDLPTEQPPGLVLAAVPGRGPQAERLLIARAAHLPGAPLLPLRPGARVGTSAPRREQQLLALRPDLCVEPLRGNVPTRVRRLREGRYDAIVLAAAGLERLQLDLSDVAVVPLPEWLVVPAPAQGALAIQVRADDGERIALCRALLHDGPSLQAVEAERALLARAGGGCNLPLGAAVASAPGGPPGGGGPRGASGGDADSAGAAGSGFVAHAFLGADHPRPGLAPRWASARGASPSAATEAAWRLLDAGEPTGCGPLGGLRVALTGSEGAASPLAERLEQLGARVLREAVLALEDLPHPDLGPLVAALRPGDALALTSRRAAAALAGLRPPPEVLVAAVGPGTARALEQAGLRPGVVGSGGAARLAELLPLERGARVLFPCAEEARPDLEQALAERGIEVRRVAVYRTRAMPEPRLDPGCDARVYTSPSAVEAALAWERAHLGRPTALLALGRTTAAALERAGLPARAALCSDEAAELPLVELLAGELARLRLERAAPPFQEASR